MSNSYLEMKAISKNFPCVKALHNVDFVVDEKGDEITSSNIIRYSKS